jgi:hypothetical protein
VRVGCPVSGLERWRRAGRILAEVAVWVFWVIIIYAALLGFQVQER